MTATLPANSYYSHLTITIYSCLHNTFSYTCCCLWLSSNARNCICSFNAFGFVVIARTTISIITCFLLFSLICGLPVWLVLWVLADYFVNTHSNAGAFMSHKLNRIYFYISSGRFLSCCFFLVSVCILLCVLIGRFKK